MARIAIVGALALLAVGCGSHATPRATAPVRLSLQAPSDGARTAGGIATVAGTVLPPRARVLVLGRRVSPDASGHFAASVPLSVGTNLIDVIASAPRARPAMIALRVIRYALVSVPDVSGRSPRAAAAVIAAAGLKPVLESDSNPFAFMIPLSMQICSQRPAGGAHVQPGSSVRLQEGKVCS